jgi:hypothetical protein
MQVKKFILLYGVSMTVGLYTTFVLVVLWDWFAVPAFHVNEIGFWIMYGLTMTSGLLRGGSDIETESRHKVLLVVLDGCVPDHKRQQVNEELEGLTEGMWWQAGTKVFGQVVGNSLTLALGFVIHILAS